MCSQAEDTSGGEDQLPQFFVKALSTVSTLVDAFLGTVTPLGPRVNFLYKQQVQSCKQQDIN